MRAGDRVGVERSGSCRDTAEEVAEVIGPGINQMLGRRAREGCEGSVLEAAWLGDSDRDNNSELKIRAYAKPFALVDPFVPQQSYKLEAIIAPILQVGKLELREVKSLAQGHSARR